MRAIKYCLIVPHYNDADMFCALLPKLKSLDLPCIVVDDGSDIKNTEKLSHALADEPNFFQVKHEHNRGKGAAVISACYHARFLGFTHVIQIDANGQHNLHDIQQFVDCSAQYPRAIISGRSYFEDSAFENRVYGHSISDFCVALETLSLQIKDSLCSFRIFPLDEAEKLIDNYHIGSRMNFDADILVKAVWANIPLHFIPTKVIHSENNISHFRCVRDKSLLIKLHVQLMCGMIVRSPMLIARRITFFLRKN